jgi:hypothetical protein
MTRPCYFETPYGGPERSSIFQISPFSVMMYAVLPMNSSELGWLSPLTSVVKVPSALTSTRDPVFGRPGEPSNLYVY